MTTAVGQVTSPSMPTPKRPISFRSQVRATLEKVKKIAIELLKGAILLVALSFNFNTPLIILGGIIGLAWPDKTEEVIDKIQHIWHEIIWTNQDWPRRIIRTSILVLAYGLTLPHSFALTSFLTAAHLGSRIAREAWAKKEEDKQPDTQAAPTPAPQAT